MTQQLIDREAVLRQVAGYLSAAMPELRQTHPESVYIELRNAIAALPVETAQATSEQNTGQDLPSEGSGLGNAHRDASQREERSPAPVYSAPVSEEREALIRFLQGAAPLDGVWLGESHSTERGAFWWRKYLPLLRAPQPDDEWKQAVIDALVVGFIYSAEHETNPRKALNDLICWEQQIALDPAVSSEARALRDSGKHDDEAVPMLREIVQRYDDYRGKGVMPAPGEYQMVVGAIEKVRAYLARKEQPR